MLPRQQAICNVISNLKFWPKRSPVNLLEFLLCSDVWSGNETSTLTTRQEVHSMLVINVYY